MLQRCYSLHCCCCCCLLCSTDEIREICINHCGLLHTCTVKFSRKSSLNNGYYSKCDGITKR
jgi:hypothetical protein